MKIKTIQSKLLFIVAILLLVGCKKIEEEGADIQESAQQIGDVMASIDESGSSSGTFAYYENQKKTFARLSPEDSLEPNLIAQLALPEAQAVSCLGFGFSACNANVVTRNFNNCTVGTATFSGTVTLTWANATNCIMNAASASITRVPNFTMTGRRGATLSVTQTGTIGQRLTWMSGTGTTKVFDFTNDGITRRFTAPNSTILFDQTTTVSGTLTVTGTARTSRVLTTSGGALIVTDNLKSVACVYTPTNVTWNSSSCNCPTQGSWSGSCSDGKSTTLNITGCGTATYTEGSETQSVTFDRCTSS